MPEGSDGIVGLAEAAQRLRVPYQTAHRLVLLGRLDGRKAGGRWYVRVADLDRFLAERSDGREDGQP